MKQWLETREVLDALARSSKEGKRAALATVVRVRGSAYRHEGAKLLVAEDGRSAGNISGGCLEQDVREVALAVIRSGKAELKTYCSSADEIAAWDLGVGCEGEVAVYVEPASEPRPRERSLLDERQRFAVCTQLEEGGAGAGTRLIVTSDGMVGSLDTADLDALARQRGHDQLDAGSSALVDIAGRRVFVDVFVPPPELVVVGAGDDARPLVRFAADVGFRVVVVDRRPSYLTHARFPAAALLVDADGEHLAHVLPLDGECYAVVMTHNFADDRAYLGALLKAPVAYVGMLGPRQRTDRILRTLGGEVALEDGRVYGPVGLDIGTDGAEQVALAVIAELLAVHSRRQPRSLRERTAPIHAPPD